MKPISVILAFMVVILAVLSVASMTGSVYGDEYLFIRITENLPDSSTSADWFLVEHPEYLSNMPESYYRNAYDTKVWVHPLLANYLMYPLFKVINPMNPSVARAIPLVLMLITMLFIGDIIRRKYNLTLACLSTIPFLLSNQLLVGGLWLYYDSFMIMFFALSLWIVYVKPESKWLYVSITAMLFSKEIGVFFMFPLLVAHYYQTSNIKRTITLMFPVLALVGWFIYVGLVTGDMLYLYHHWQSIQPATSFTYLDRFMNNARFYLINWGLLFYFLITLPGFIVSVLAMLLTSNKTYLAFTLFYLITIFYAVGWGYVPYHVHLMLYSSMMMTAFGVSMIYNKPMVK